MYDTTVDALNTSYSFIHFSSIFRLVLFPKVHPDSLCNHWERLLLLTSIQLKSVFICMVSKFHAKMKRDYIQMNIDTIRCNTFYCKSIIFRYTPRSPERGNVSNKRLLLTQRKITYQMGYNPPPPSNALLWTLSMGYKGGYSRVVHGLWEVHIVIFWLQLSS